MNRLSYIFLPLTAIGMSACSSGKEEVKRPNIIVMMTDDHTTQAMSCYGGRFLQTPNMDNVMKLFDQTNAWNLPVVENGKYIGFVSNNLSPVYTEYQTSAHVPATTEKPLFHKR